MNTYSVLYIDDDTSQVRASADTLRLHLRRLGFSFALFTSVEDVETYLGAAPPEKPALAIVDLWMNGKTTNVADTQAGFKVIRMLRQYSPSVYIVVVSAHVDDAAKEHLRGYRDITIVEKPIIAEELLRLIDHILKEMTA